MVTLVVLTGLPGSGKSTHAERLVATRGMTHVSMDEAVLARGLSLVDYEARFALQGEVEASIPRLLADGTSVIAEFGSWSREERTRLRRLSDASGARTELHWLDTSIETCMARVLGRGGPDAHALAHEVIAGSAEHYETPTDEELREYQAFEIIRQE